MSTLGPLALVQLLFPFLEQGKGWYHQQIWLLLILCYLSAGFFRLAYGELQFILGDQRALVVGNFSHSLFVVSLIVAPGPLALIIAPFFFGLGNATAFTAGPVRVLDVTAREYHGHVSGAFFELIFLGQAIGVVVLGWVLATFGTSALVLSALGFGLLSNLVILFVPRRHFAKTHVTLLQVVRLLVSSGTRYIAFLLFIGALSLGLILSTFVQLIVSQYGIGFVPLLTLGFYLARLPASVIAGTLATHWGVPRLLFLTFALSGVGLTGVFVLPSALLVLMVGALLGFQQATSIVAAMTLAGQSTDEKLRHASFAPLMAAAEIGVAAAVASSGMLQVITLDFSTGLGVFGLVFLASSLVIYATLIRVPKSR